MYKNFFFLVYFKKYDSNENKEVEFKIPKEDFPQCMHTINENDNIIKIFKFFCTDDTFNSEFYFGNNFYKLTINNLKNRAFIFDINLQKVGYVKTTNVEQTDIELSMKIKYFLEALGKQEENKKDILLFDSINLFNEKPSLDLLFYIFSFVYNKLELCSNLFVKFNANKNKLLQKENNDFDSIYQCLEDFISEKSGKNLFDMIDFYGFIFGYSLKFYFDKFIEKFNELYKNDKNNIFEVMSKYKLFFNEEFRPDKIFLNEYIIFCSSKDFKSFKESGLYYLNNVNIFLDIVDNNKEIIIQIKDFSPLEVPKIKKGEKINFDLILLKIEEIISFSINKNILLIYFDKYFFENIANKLFKISRDNIKKFRL